MRRRTLFSLSQIATTLLILFQSLSPLLFALSLEVKQVRALEATDNAVEVTVAPTETPVPTLEEPTPSPVETPVLTTLPTGTATPTPVPASSQKILLTSGVSLGVV